MYECSLERMTDKIKTMSQFGDAGHGGITRYSLSPEALQARGEFVRRMEAIGATIKFDELWKFLKQLLTRTFLINII